MVAEAKYLNNYTCSLLQSYYLFLFDLFPLFREVAVLRSSENKFYVLLFGVTVDGTGGYEVIS